MDDGYNWDNHYFSMAVNAIEEQQPRRIKGYFICPINSGCGSDFIKAKATTMTVCPLCGNPSAFRIKFLDDVEFRLTIARWKEECTYSDVRADLILNGKERAS